MTIRRMTKLIPCASEVAKAVPMVKAGVEVANDPVR